MAKIVEAFELTFFAKVRWPVGLIPFVVPGEGYWLDTDGIERLRASTFEDFNVATQKRMPAYIPNNSLWRISPKTKFRLQEKAYRLCRKVAVSSDGKVYRATDAEIESALKTDPNAPSCSAVIYVKAVQEVRRRHAVSRARQGGSG